MKSIKIDYRHFNCVARYKSYKNKAEVGEMLKETVDMYSCLMKREDLFVTTKLGLESPTMICFA